MYFKPQQGGGGLIHPEGGAAWALCLMGWNERLLKVVAQYRWLLDSSRCVSGWGSGGTVQTAGRSRKPRD